MKESQPMKKFLRNVLCFITAIVMLSLTLSLTGCSSEKETVVIYTHDYDELIPSFMEFLEGEFPDVEFIVIHMSGGTLDAKIQAEGKDTEIDIIHGSSSGANRLKSQDMLTSFTPGSTFQSEFADPDNVIAPNGVWCGAFLVNTEELEKHGLDMPASFLDLLDPQYKGHIVMANPVSSSTGRFFLLGILNTFGEQEGWAYFEALNENIFQYTESGSGPGNSVSMGEAVIGLGMDYQGHKLIEDGSPLEVVFAEEGAPWDYDTIVVINKEEVRPIVLEVAKAMTTVEGNAVFNNYSKSVIQGDPDRVEYAEGFKFLDMTGITDPDKRAEIEAGWEQRIG
jgi:iron(III) transport system substrate-binding protein